MDTFRKDSYETWTRNPCAASRRTCQKRPITLDGYRCDSHDYWAILDDGLSCGK